MTGPIPDLSRLTRLTTLNLGNNQLTGSIPAWLGQLTSLKLLRMSANQFSGDFPAALGNLTKLQLTRFASNTDANGNPSLTGCVPNGLRYLMTAEDFESDEFDPDRRLQNIPAQDFIAKDANTDGDTDDPDDTPGLNLPFCMVSALAFSDVTLEPAFASDTVVYTASAAYTVEFTTVTAGLHNNSDTISITKGADIYMGGASVPLDVGPNAITIEITPYDGTPMLTYTVTIFREGADRAALMSLYRSTHGTRWWRSTNWGSTKPISTWYGVTTNIDGRVTELHLRGNNLVGSLPAALGDLDQLVSLQLASNQLSGAIPASLGDLTNLQELSISDNHMSGSIPDLSGLTNLEELFLLSNQLSGTIPVSLGDLTSLQKLDLSSNQLDGTIPTSLNRLINLTVLGLSSNQLDGTIPTSLNRLTRLQDLDLSFNQLDGTIPTSLNSLISLRDLTLDNNQLSGTIPDLSSLASLQVLLLHNNNLMGGIPASLNSLTSLHQLYLEHNQLSGSIPDLRNLDELVILSLRNNQLTGPIPAWLGDLTDLGGLYLSVNQLSGDFPQELGNLTNLYFAHFASNPSLTGCVPLGLRYLVTDERDHDFSALNLPFCMLSTLEFSDVILTPAFASATTVYTASVVNTVESTMVTPTLADSSDRFSIKKKKGRRTYASGEAVPLAVGSNVITIKVNPKDRTPKPTYTVTIFREGVDRATLTALYNSAGGASWTDKTNWGSPTEPLNTWFGVKVDGNGNVTELALPDNNLSGPLPAELGSLTSLTTLDFSDNQLSGTLPDLSTLTSLTSLNLGDNQVSGTVPDWLGSLIALQELSLRDNRLTGPIPEELGDLVALQNLYLDNNQLSGAIPDWLSDLDQLRNLYLNGNRLSGCVPDGSRAGLINHDFIAVDANGDGDTTDAGDTPGLPFCTLNSLDFSDVTLNPEFTSSTITYTGSAAHDVATTTVTAPLNNASNTVSIIKGADTYQDGDAVPLDVGANVIAIQVTRPDDPLTPHTYTVTVTRAPNTPPAFEGATTTRGMDENTAAGRDIGDPVAASDTEKDTLAYSLDTTSAESFDIDAPSGQLQTKADLDFEDKPSYTVTVSVSDGMDANGDADEVTDDTIRVTIQVSDLNEAPEFSSDTAERNVHENTVAGVNIGAPVAADDDDDNTLTYSLDLFSRATFDIDSTTGQLQTKAALDYETGTTSYTVDVTAADPLGAADTITVTITVGNVEEPGKVTLSSTQPIEGTPLTATLEDPDNVIGTVTWSWARSSSRTALGTPISGATSDSYTPVSADVGRYLRATASYTDGEGSDKSASLVSTNRVQPAPVDPNEWPQFPSTETGARSVDENTSARVNIGEPVAATDPEDDTLTYSLDAASLATFDIVSTTGQLQTKAALNYESGTTSHTVDVTATDTAGGEATISVTITVNNLDEPATVTLSSLQPLVAIPLTATLDDPDDVRGDVTWSWARSPNGTSSWIPIIGETSDTYTPVLDNVGDYLRATAFYTDGEESGKSAQAVSANAVEVAPGRSSPVFREHPTATRSVPRNTPAGRNIGAPVSATDADNDALTYNLGGRDRAGFDLDASSGQLLTKALLTGINRTSYEVFVSVSDGKDDFGEPETDRQIDTTTEVTINVTTTTTTTRSGGGSSGGRSRSRATPTPIPSPTPTATPTPTGPQFSGVIAAEPSVTATVVPEGTTLGVNGGGDLPGGVYVNFPPTAVALPVQVSVSLSNTAPDDVEAPSGTTLLPLTIDIAPETPLTLGTPLTIEINPTPEQLAATGGDLNHLAVGVVTPNGIVVLPTQVLHGRLVVTTNRLAPFVLVAITDPGPVLRQPPMGDASSMGPLLQWTQPPETTWFQVQVIPFNEDGPGINLVIGDSAQVRAAQYQVMAPNFGSADPNYVLLPDLTYLWRVRTTTVLTNPTEEDWSAWAASSFKTPPASSSTITRVAPPLFGEVSTLTPTLTWANSNAAVFYYEVQLSRDFEFGPNAFLYSEYVHGGASTPPNSYVVPEAFPLEAGEIYYWRVRPRIQGDGDPLPWSRINVFQTPG